MKAGQHIFVKRLGYTHHGVVVGKNTIIHYSGELLQKSNAAIIKTTLEDFSQGATVQIQRYEKSIFTANEIALRAHNKLGESRYNLIFNNCEHFARWCCIGQHLSEQVKDTAASAAGAIGTRAAQTAGLGVISSTGSVAGMSGPGIMSGLAKTGSLVGGGAVAGITVLAALPATATTLAMHKVLADDALLPHKERDARSAGRKATVVGAVGGAAGTLATISSAGTVAGLSGPGISTALVAIGPGGMATGAGIAIAAPAMAAAGVGYGVYRLFKWLTD